MKSVNPVWVVLLVLLGLFGGGWSSARLSQGGEWEYAMRHIKDGDQNPIINLNELGKEGWELIGVESGWAYFKRPKK